MTDFGWSLPPGCSLNAIDEAFGDGSGIPEPEHSITDGTVTLKVDGVAVRLSFYTEEQAEAFIEAYSSAYKVEGSPNGVVKSIVRYEYDPPDQKD